MLISLREYRKSKFFVMSLLQAAALCRVILMIEIDIFFTKKPVYSLTFSQSEFQKTPVLFCVLLINMVLNVFENVIIRCIHYYTHSYGAICSEINVFVFCIVLYNIVVSL